MSDGESSTAFTEFKDNTTNETIVNVPQSHHPVKNTGGFDVETNPHPTWSVNWAMFYLSQTRVMVMLVLVLFFFSLIISVYAMGGPSGHHNTVLLCPEWREVVPDASSKCPAQTLQLMSKDGLIEKGITFSLQDDMTKQPPLAFFLPRASMQYYYTIIVVDPDAPTPRQPQRQTIVGIAANVRLAETMSLEDSWITPWDVKSGGGTHRLVFLVYRHLTEYHGTPPPIRHNFKIDDWFKANWYSIPELVAANYFKFRED